MVVRTPTGLSFPEFEEGLHLSDLVSNIATALGTKARKPVGNALELLVGFEGYPDEFALWWDGFSCELGPHAPPRIDVADVAEALFRNGCFRSA